MLVVGIDLTEPNSFRNRGFFSNSVGSYDDGRVGRGVSWTFFGRGGVGTCVSGHFKRALSVGSALMYREIPAHFVLDG